MWEGNCATQAGVDLIEGVRIIWSLLNTGFTLYSTRRIGNERAHSFIPRVRSQLFFLLTRSFPTLTYHESHYQGKSW